MAKVTPPPPNRQYDGLSSVKVEPIYGDYINMAEQIRQRKEKQVQASKKTYEDNLEYLASKQVSAEGLEAWQIESFQNRYKEHENAFVSQMSQGKDPRFNMELNNSWTNLQRDVQMAAASNRVLKEMIGEINEGNVKHGDKGKLMEALRDWDEQRKMAFQKEGRILTEAPDLQSLEYKDHGAIAQEAMSVYNKTKRIKKASTTTLGGEKHSQIIDMPDADMYTGQWVNGKMVVRDEAPQEVLEYVVNHMPDYNESRDYQLETIYADTDMTKQKLIAQDYKNHVKGVSVGDIRQIRDEKRTTTPPKPRKWEADVDSARSLAYEGVQSAKKMFDKKNPDYQDFSGWLGSQAGAARFFNFKREKDGEGNQTNQVATTKAGNPILELTVTKEFLDNHGGFFRSIQEGGDILTKVDEAAMKEVKQGNAKRIEIELTEDNVVDLVPQIMSQSGVTEEDATLINAARYGAKRAYSGKPLYDEPAWAEDL